MYWMRQMMRKQEKTTFLHDVIVLLQDFASKECSSRDRRPRGGQTPTVGGGSFEALTAARLSALAFFSTFLASSYAATAGSAALLTPSLRLDSASWASFLPLSAGSPVDESLGVQSSSSSPPASSLIASSVPLLTSAFGASPDPALGLCLGFEFALAESKLEGPEANEAEG
ncbi:MAG: hypothetical protein FRX49_10964 [Trebouxia sp. A1-2]|nr:MAG: hypothetical protein FRX49_10964 [Trebouxia sp. A1-2]